MKSLLLVRLTTAALVLGFNISTAGAGVVAVVSSKSPITTLTKNQVVNIFLGKQVLFPDGSAAVPIDQIEESPDRLEFYSRLADMSAAQLKAFWAKIIFTGRGQPPKTVANGVEAKKALAANPAGIAYIDQSLVDDRVRVVLVP